MTGGPKHTESPTLYEKTVFTLPLAAEQERVRGCSQPQFMSRTGFLLSESRLLIISHVEYDSMSNPGKLNQEMNRQDMAKELENYSRCKYAPNNFAQFMTSVEHVAYGGNSQLANEMTRSLFLDWKTRGKSTTGNLVQYISNSLEVRSLVKAALFSALAALDKGKSRAPTSKDLRTASQPFYKIFQFVVDLTTCDNKSKKLDEEFLRNGATPNTVAQVLTMIMMALYEELSDKLKAHVNANGFAVNYIALACLNVRDDINAEKFCNEGIDFLEDTSEFELLARLYQTKGNLHKTTGDRSMAEKSFKTAEDYASKITDESRRTNLQKYIAKDLENVQEAVCNDDPVVHHPCDDLR